MRFRSVLSPLHMYELLPRLVKRLLFPFVTIGVDRLERASCALLER
ncbi:MAG: hypothetical protein IRZ16_19205 [Myxococcaceae bacterium]|nr:hypothetical protein [Myxococcaceae bacterium]